MKNMLKILKKLIRRKRLKIYKIDMVFLKEDESDFQKRVVRNTTWGFFKTKEIAIQAIKENWTDLFEVGHYTHGVVSEIEEGISSFPRKQWWYKADYEKREGNNPAVDLVFISNSIKDSRDNPLNKGSDVFVVFGGWGM